MSNQDWQHTHQRKIQGHAEKPATIDVYVNVKSVAHELIAG
jgi:hypothetical protein